MPLWLTILITVFGALGGSTLMSIIWQNIADAHARQREQAREDRANKKRKEEDEIAQKRHDDMIIEVQNMLAPIHEELSDIKSELAQNKVGTVSSLRANMMLLRDSYRNQGFATGNDKAAWNQLYKDYTELGGNHFREYVDQWKEEVNNMAEEKIVLRKTNKGE